MTSRTRSECLSLNSVLLDSGEIQWGTTSSDSIPLPPLSTALECGTAAVEVRTAPDCMIAELYEDNFRVFPLREDYRSSTERRPAPALRKRRSVRAQGTIGHVADEQRPL